MLWRLLGVEDGIEMFECAECAYATTNQQDYQRHLVSHNKDVSSKERRASHDSVSSVRNVEKFADDIS